MTTVRYLVAGVTLALLGACGAGAPVAPADRYYSLVLAGDDTAAPVNGATRLLVIGPIGLAEYLHRPGIAVQVGPNSIQSAERHRWAEPLEDSIGKVLVLEIERHSPGLAVERDVSSRTAQADCRVRLEVDAFHPTSDGRAVMNGRYWLGVGPSGSRQSFALERGLGASGYERAVDVLREMLGTLGQAIAADIAATGTCELPKQAGLRE